MKNFNVTLIYDGKTTKAVENGTFDKALRSVTQFVQLFDDDEPSAEKPIIAIIKYNFLYLAEINFDADIVTIFQSPFRQILKNAFTGVFNISECERTNVDDLPDDVDEDTTRVCDVCGALMNSGFLVDECRYYCSELCLYTEYTFNEYRELYNDDCAYYTEWD